MLRATLARFLTRDVDHGFHRQAYAKRMGGELLGIEGNANGEPLHDLDPVARRVLGGDQCERRSGATCKTHDVAMELDLAAINVAGERHRLSGANALELPFLEIGVDVDAADRDDRHDGCAGGNALADLN